MISVRYNDNGTVARLEKLFDQVKNPRALLAVLGREGANQLKKHFRGKDRTDASRLGEAANRRQHFWLQVERSVQSPVVRESSRSVAISINDPRFAQKVFGGLIRAKRVRNLSIPVTPEAYGRAPKVFEKETGLKLIFLKQRDNILLASVRGLHRLQVEYILTPSVYQKPDPTALPDQQKFEQALVDRGQKVVDRQAAGGPVES